MKKELKEKINSALCSGAICGGVISKSLFDSDPMAYMLSFYMEDEKFAEFVKEKDPKKQDKLFEKYARSAI